MPNWCKGVLKVRGKKRDLLKFLNEGIKDIHYKFDDQGHSVSEYLSPKIKTDENETEIILSECAGNLYIEGTRRSFITNNIDWWWSYDDEEKIYTQLIDIQQAWRLEVEQFSEISRKYHIDFKIKGYECGMEFSQEFEIIQGNITMYQEQTYENYIWEVDDPRIGG